MQRERDRERDKTEERRARDKDPKRKEMHAKLDKVRDQEPKRKEMHAELDNNRDQTDERRARDQDPKRKQMHAELDKLRDQDPERKQMHAELDNIRDQTDERKARDQDPKRKQMHVELDKVRDQDPKRKQMHVELDKVRDQDPKRKQMHAELDNVRDQDPKRKKMHKELDKVRDKTPKRKKMHQRIDQVRDQTEARIFRKKTKDSVKYQNKLYATYSTDTGFDVFCSCCLQYKSLEYCKLVNVLSEEKKSKFIVKYSALLKNRSDDQHVCNVCLKDILKDKTPKRSKKSKFKFANFPRYLIQSLKKICKIKKSDLPFYTAQDVENHERQALQLNRLESYLLKLVIPFIRVIHCPRGSYFKVKGDLILISSDIGHSLSKILPVDQSLIPVCFKRKLSYTGSYVEEYIEKEKVILYFSWFKKYNHLYKDELQISVMFHKTQKQKQTNLNLQKN